ncbi:MAG: ATP-dependent sacrificial sulfur transferase LarE [Thermoanaerobaculales bacterium]|nr:ATP-dependent sacrificial sulfur transferase LarE [Thermoanaerobaculales bacterium]
MSDPKAAEYNRLLRWFRETGSVLVAYSGGVDSTLLAKAAHDALGERALALTAVSASLAPHELDEARELAESIGIEHRLEHSGETSKPQYLVNDADRCYHCKSELYTICARVAVEAELAVIVNGLNTDDLSDHRPGNRAADEAGIRSPFVELGFDKATIRAHSARLDLPTASKPELACLASRFPTGTGITVLGLKQVAAAEAVVADLGFSQYRVRFHGVVARLELPADEIARIANPGLRQQLVEGIKAAGFLFVTVDLAGYSRGSSNPVGMGTDGCL